MAAQEEALMDMIMEEEEIILSALLLDEQGGREPRRWCVRPLNLEREVKGEFTLVADMRAMDPKQHFHYFRMSSARFDDLLRRVGPFIQHDPSRHSLPISPHGRLAVALRVLASGNTQQSVAESYRLASSTVSNIVGEVTRAIWTALKDEFLVTPSSPAEWREIAKEYWRLWNFPNLCGSLDGKQNALIDFNAV